MASNNNNIDNKIPKISRRGRTTKTDNQCFQHGLTSFQLRKGWTVKNITALSIWYIIISSVYVKRYSLKLPMTICKNGKSFTCIWLEFSYTNRCEYITELYKKHKQYNGTTKLLFKCIKIIYIPADIYLFKVNNGNTRKVCEICSKLTIKTPEGRHCLCKLWVDLIYCSRVSTVGFEKVNTD